MDFLSDSEISELINESKSIPLNFEFFLKNWKGKKGHLEFDHKISRNDGSYFLVKLRQSKENKLDFSVIFAYSAKGTSKIFRLMRYTGKSHVHKNALEKENKFYDYHIHKATEKYQKEGRKEESYAEVTTRYSDINGALRCLIEDCNITLKEDPQLGLFVK